VRINILPEKLRLCSNDGLELGPVASRRQQPSTKAWADKNRTISGTLVGGAAGTIVPGLGTAIGAIVGAGIGFASSMEKKDDRAS
jgi:hypothetical protein